MAMGMVPVVVPIMVMAMGVKMNNAAVMAVNMEMNALADQADQYISAQPDQHHPDG